MPSVPWVAAALVLFASACAVEVATVDDGEDGHQPGDGHEHPPGGVDEGPGDDGEGGGVARYDLTASPAAQTITLDRAADYDLVVASEGFSGTVALQVGGLPGSWAASFSQATVDLSPGASVPVTLSVDVPSEGEATTATLALTATGSLGDVAATAALTVADELVIPIAAGTGGGDHALGGVRNIRRGTTVRFVNEDAAAHQIHADGMISHQDAPFGQGESYTAIAGPGVALFYCHIHGDDSGTGELDAL